MTTNFCNVRVHAKSSFAKSAVEVCIIDNVASASKTGKLTISPQKENKKCSIAHMAAVHRIFSPRRSTTNMGRSVEYFGGSPSYIKSSSIEESTSAIADICSNFHYIRPIVHIVINTTTHLPASLADYGSARLVGHRPAANSNVLWATTSSITNPACLSYAIFVESP